MQSIATAAEISELNRRIARGAAAVRAEIERAAVAAGRDPGTVTLVAVSKTQSAAAVRAAAAAGLTHFGENYLQEALQKIADCAELNLTWHYIGAIQSNKTRAVAENFDWVHTLDRQKIARRLNDQCPAGKRLNVCLQVNVDRDPNKAGVSPDAAAELLEAAADMENLNLRGLMTILHPRTDPTDGYEKLAELFAELRPGNDHSWDSLSMGMSGDYRSAISAGATLVRVGTAIFGPRQTPGKTTQVST